MKSALIAVLLAAAPAEQAQRPCLTQAQVEAMTLFALPPLLEGAAKACAPALPVNSYLMNGGRTLAQSLAAESSTHWASASRAVTMLGGKEFPAGLSETTARGLIHDLVLNGLSTAKGREQCGRIDRAADLLSPLPPRNLAGLVVLGVEIATVEEINDSAKGKAKGEAKAKPASKAPLMCPAPRP
ncbi:MAG TPA: hypothetical protein VF782_06180 [Allosphingosinicella sp.]|jgi:hypothetical protein